MALDYNCRVKFRLANLKNAQILKFTTLWSDSKQCSSQHGVKLLVDYNCRVKFRGVANLINAQILICTTLESESKQCYSQHGACFVGRLQL